MNSADRCDQQPNQPLTFGSIFLASEIGFTTRVIAILQPGNSAQMQIDVETWPRLQKVQRHGETISDCIIRATQHRRGLR